MVWFQLLGHVSARSERGQVPLGSARQRAVLAALLIEPGVHVSVEQLVDRVWGTTPPRSARQTLHSYVSRLRSVLGDEGGPLLERRSGGYVLEADESAVDLQRFRALVAQARGADDDHAGALWQEAMGLWQGRPFADLDSDWLRSVAVRLEAERLAAVLDHNDLLLRSGEHAGLLPEVGTAARAHPLDERLAGQLMLALYRCDRQADALAHYRLVQERLADELGSDPGPTLRELYQRILRHDDELAAPTEVPGPASYDPGSSEVDGAAGGDAAEGVPVAVERSRRPAQLPLDAAGFTGRADEMRRLDELLSDASADRGRREVVVTAISGTAGVGKTALAVHWAHQVADQFPDGQLYVNLRGYDPDQPMRPADALARFLAALGVAERDIPLDSDERAARYRSELAERRMLIVLDNAGSVAQVRPLLPGSGTSLVLVTSRDSLAGLFAVHGAHQVGLDLLPAAEAVDLLHRLIGDRVVTERAAAATLAEQCARLPLALRVAAVLATPRPDRSLADVVAELADRQERLELLDPGGDPYAAVHAVFSWSIQHLPEQAAHTFRRLSLHPGPDLDPYVAAALTGLEPNRARRILETLVSAHLLHRTGAGRYGMHDLLRAYAARLATALDTEHERQTAERRLLDYYQGAAYAAVSSLYPAEVQYQPDGTPDAPLPDLSEPTSAREWLRAERGCLAAVAEHAADRHDDRYVVGLALILHRYVNSAHPVDLFVVNAHALRAAEEAGNLAGQAQVLRQLGVGHSQAGRYETALEHFHRALALFQQSGDLVGEAHTLTNLASIDHRRGDHKVAREGHYRALAVARRAGDRFAEASVRNNLVGVEAGLGNIDAAYETCRQALAIFQDIGARYCEAIALNNLANTELERGEYTTAAERLRRSLATAEALGIVTMRAYVLDSLGMLHLYLEEPDEAASYFGQALVVCRETGDVSGQAWSFNGLGEAALLAGSTAEALRSHTEALGIAIQVGSRDQQARAHAGIGHAHHALGDPDLARSHYEHAYVIYIELENPEAADMLALMGEVPAT
ncbi:AfsR/SARP family transcriptional regulator [Promicromonospora soli]|uniref:SARP family transcriptional regulator n=1 Tax=Promicromonospora soli TaxID=2035533 RepID=A0A919G2L5_9MICO|nr:BTAD domain-containing putative transcriptional regulator [Promicromonospora soli]GHH76443.1 SARP family transcriptional regulator [Promicromonospora soli]